MNPTTITGGKHGTKWIAGLGMATAVLSNVDPSMLPPSWLPYVMGAMSLLTFARGAINTANAQQP